MADAAEPGRLRSLHAAGVLDDAAYARALALSSASPSPRAWRVFLDRALIALGTALVLSGVLYLLAFNWEHLDRFARIGLVAGLVGASGIGALVVGLETWGGRMLAVSATVLTGGLLAVYGQAYQTGADAWELFATWTVIVLPIVLASRFQVQWLLLQVLASVTLATWWFQTLDSEPLWLAVCLAAVQAVAWGAREVVSRPWLTGRWLPRTQAAAAFTFLTGPAVWFFVEEGHAVGGVALVALVALSAFVVRAHRDRFLDALPALSWLVVLTTLAGRVCLDWLDLDEAGFFVMALIVIVEVSLATLWLRLRLSGDA